MSFFDTIGDMLFGGDDEETTQKSTSTTVNQAPQWSMAPEYAEASGARTTWSDMLKKWGSMPGYGAIAPDWGDIWNKYENKVNRYYWGGSEEGGGVAGKVRASAARRNVSQSPAMEAEIAKMGMAQGNQLAEMGTQMATKEAEFGEQGRNNWMSWLMSLAGQKPQVASYSPGSTTSGTTTTTSPSEGIIGPLLGMAGSVIGGKQNMDWLTKLLGGGGQGNPGYSLPDSVDNGNAFGDVANIASSILPLLGLL